MVCRSRSRRLRIRLTRSAPPLLHIGALALVVLIAAAFIVTPTIPEPPTLSSGE